MIEYVVSGLSGLPNGVSTFLIAMLPIAELRAAIPIAISVYKMDPLWAFVYAVLGNIALGIIILFFVENMIHIFLNRSHRLNNLWQRYINRLHTKNKKSFEKWGAIGLVIFVAIPLPLTGVASGAVIASIFQIPFRQAIPLLCLGVVIAGGIVTFLTVGVVAIF